MTVFSRGATLLATLLLGLPAFAAPLTATLKLKGQMTMEQLASNVQDPKSSHFNRFYEPAEIRLLAGPSDADYADLVSGLKAEGMTIVYESPTHLWLTVRGEQAIFESLFSTRVVALAKGLHTHSSPVRIPAHLALIESVTGLDNTRKSYPHYRKLDVPAGVGGITQTAIKTAYGFNQIYQSGLTGKGQTIAIATYDGFSIGNVNEFYTQSNISPAPAVDQVMFNGTPTYNAGSAGETELDSEFTGMIAPGATIHVFASATNDDAGELALFTAILDDNRATVVNYSWGGCEPQVTPQHKNDMQAVFARAVAQGVNLFAASGDLGSDTCNDNTNKADWPAAAPYFVAVGGTSFDNSSGTLNETGWNGSGGGISGVWALPTWQQSLGGIYTMRSYPDVAFNADPNSAQAIFTGNPGQWELVGGTSMASPQWVGFMTLLGEARAKAGKAPIGYVAPQFYTMSAQVRAQTFNDVTSGNNGLYNAGPGWDAVTGWGSMQANNLLNYLLSL